MYLSSTKEEFEKLKRQAKGDMLIIGGDFNSPDIDWPSLSIQGSRNPRILNQTILNIVNKADLEQTVDFQARKNKVLDLIMTIHSSFKGLCKPLPSLGNSDHEIVLYDTSLTPLRPKPPRRKLCLWKRADVNDIREDLQECADAFAPDFIPDSPIEQLWADFREIVLRIVEKRVPSKTTVERNSNSRINTSMRKNIRRKQCAHKKARKTGKKRDIDRYERVHAEVNFDIKRMNRSYLEEIISEDFNTDPKKFRSYIKNKRQESTGVSPLKNQDGFLKSDSTSKAEILNTQFKSIFTEEDLSNLPHKGESLYPGMDNMEVSEKGVFRLLQNL